MSLNPSENKFFQTILVEQKRNPGKSFQEMTIEEIRDAVTFFADFSGKKADVPCSEDTVKVRDGSKIQISILVLSKLSTFILNFHLTSNILC